MDHVTAQAAAGVTAAPGGRLAEIEVLRAVAILLVLAQHVPSNLIFWPNTIAQKFFQNAGFWTGVDLFFVISGFVIARALLPRLAGVTGWRGFTEVTITFWIARAWRLLPSSWLWLMLPLLLCTAFNRSGVYGTLHNNWATGISGLLDLANFHLALAYDHFGSGTAFVQWSLSLEEQFYLALPFAAFFLRRHLVVLLLIIALFGFVAPNTPLMHMVRLWPVAMGVLLAMWSAHPSYRACAPSGLAASRFARIGLFAGLLVCLVSLGTEPLHIVTFYMGPVALLCAGLVWLASYDRGFLWQEGWPRRVMEIIAARSYSLYLVHIPVYFAAHEIWFRLHGAAIPGHHRALAIVAGTLAAVAVVAELNHRLLERPLREHGRRLAAAYRAGSALRPAEARPV
jgi:peptidoglycan/LPS O-acetylase OafA/YrhL